LQTKRGKWGQLPRGDQKHFKKKTMAVLAKVQGKILNELLQSAIKRALENYEKDSKKKASFRQGMEKMRRYTQAHNFADEDIERMRQEELAHLEIEEEQKLVEDAAASSDDDDDEWGGVMETGFGPGGASAHRAAASATAAAVMEQNSPQSPTDDWGGANDWGGPEQALASRSRGGTSLNLMSLRKKSHAMTTDTILAEFKNIPNKPFPASKLPADIKQYSRNLKFIPVPHTAVQVNPKENEANTRYINASYIPGPSGEPKRYIVTQAPQSGRHSAQGKGKTIDAFWSMVYSHKSTVIVMIEGSQPYVPEGEPGTTQTFHKIRVTLRSVETRTHWVKTTVELNHARVEGSSRIVHHFNFTGWPRSAAAPTSTAPIMQLMDQVMQKVEENPNAPVIVQDLCGGGKAGTYIAIEYAMQALDESVTDDPATTHVDVAAIVQQLRESRPGLVAFAAEYVFVHKVVTMYSLELEAPLPPAYTEPPPM
jgi:protein tyrosine phosphatase